MKLEEALNHFGTGYRLCKTLGIALQNYNHWKIRGSIPFTQQIRIEHLTDGKLKADVWKSPKKKIEKANQETN